MVSGNSNFSTILTTTLANYGKEIFDAVSTNNALLFILKKAGNIKIVAGGESFNHPLIYGTNSSFQAYSSMETISLPLTNLATRAVFPQKVLAGSIVLSSLEMAQNAGQREKLLDLAEVKKKEAEISMSELMGDQVFADGSGAKDFDGIQYLINESPASQTDVGGIDSSASGNEYWRNYSSDTVVSAFNTSNEGLNEWRLAVTSTTKGRQGPKLIVTTPTIFNLYETGLTANIRYVDTELADAGFLNLQYKTMPVVFDDNCPSGNTYFVDTDSLWLQVLAQANMQITQFQQHSDKLATSAIMWLAGNLTTGSRRTQGVIDSTTG